MRLRSEIAVGFGAVLAIQILTSFAAIAMLARMAPAVERILEENVVSITAVEEMLAVLAVGGPDAPARFATAAERARANVTEQEEPALLEVLEARGPAAVAGDPEARAAVVASLTQLADVNRRSMERMDRHARALGTGGAWVVAVLGALGFGLGTLASRRIARRIGEPLAEVDATLLAAAGGDRLRRCSVGDAPVELTRIAQEVNELLDERLEAPARPAWAGSEVDRGALIAFLDDLDVPVVVIDGAGGLRAANLAAQDLLYGPLGVESREALHDVPAGRPNARIARARAFDAGWVCWLSTAAAVENRAGTSG